MIMRLLYCSERFKRRLFSYSEVVILSRSKEIPDDVRKIVVSLKMIKNSGASVLILTPA